jgi:L-threonylcarbamoyladenylate synthase
VGAPSDDDIDAAVDLLRRGGVIGLPTETVYGLAADASNEAAVRRIFAVKCRPTDHPLIVHLAAAEQLERWAASIPPSAAVLSDACWPGPLSVIVPRADHVLDVVTGGRSTVALRVPAHPVAHAVLTRFGGGVAAPSANRFGRVSPTTAEHVRADLGSDVDFVLDGGASPVGVESTIVDCTVSPAQILRPGGISNEEIDRLLSGAVADPSGPSRASGMLASHYAPLARVEVFESAADARQRADTARAEGRRVTLLDATGDPVVAAQHLFVWLRRADEDEMDVIVALLPRAAGLGHAIRDRLFKASGQG